MPLADDVDGRDRAVPAGGRRRSLGRAGARAGRAVRAREPGPRARPAVRGRGLPLRRRPSVRAVRAPVDRRRRDGQARREDGGDRPPRPAARARPAASWWSRWVAAGRASPRRSRCRRRSRRSSSCRARDAMPRPTTSRRPRSSESRRWAAGAAAAAWPARVVASNVVAGARVAAGLGPDLVVFDGSGAALPPVAADRTVVVVGGAPGAPPSRPAT